MNEPFFSIIVPTHRRASLLRRCLLSIRSQVLPVAFEIIVVSDYIERDTDSVCNEILAPTDIYLRRNGENGPSESRNLAMSLAKGAYVLFLDDDDAFHPQYFESLYQQVCSRPNVVTYANCSVVKEQRLPEGPKFISEVNLDLNGRLTDDVYIKNQVHMSCYAFPKFILDGIYFDKTMRAYEDWDFTLSVVDKSMPVHVPILASKVFEVDDASTDRRGSSAQANDFNAILDYLYVYRRHPAPDQRLKQLRAHLLSKVGIAIPPEML